MADVLDFGGEYGSDTRAPRVGAAARKPWAKDPSSPAGSDGTRLDATFANDLVALIRATLAAFGITSGAGEDTALADAIRAAVSSSVGVANGIAPLDESGLVPAEFLPAIAITETLSASSDADMIALTAQRGDICIRDDLSKSYILSADPASILANWKLLKTPTDAVLSVAGLVGAITAAALKAALAISESDVSGLPADLAAINSALSNKAPLASPAFSGNPTAPNQTAGDNSQKLATTAFVTAAIAAISSGVVSFNTRTGAITLTSSDVTTALGFVPPPNSRSVSASGLASGGGDLSANRTINVPAAGASDFRGKTDNAKALTTKAAWDAIGVVSLVYGATVTPDFATGIDFFLTLAGNASLLNPTNLVAGQKGRILIAQDATGSWSLSYGSYFKWEGGVVGVLATAPGAYTFIDYDVVSTSFIRASLSKAWA